jgi:hypothetical protein
MRKIAVIAMGAGMVLSFALTAAAQNAPGSLEFEARITPTAAKPEPVRQFTFYILRRSYTDIVKELEEKDPPPARDAFIDGQVAEGARNHGSDHAGPGQSSYDRRHFGDS